METNKKVYYKGHPTRGAEIIKALESLGGENKDSLDCIYPGRIYFINPKNKLDSTKITSYLYDFIIDNYTELTLPEPKIEFKDGDFFVVPATESSYYYIGCFNKKENDVVYCHFGMITIDNKKDFWIECHIENPYYLKLMRRASEEEKQILLSELSKIGKIWNAEKKCIEGKPHKFKPFDRILVKHKSDIYSYWTCDIFSHIECHSSISFFECVGDCYNINDYDIIPYEGNEHLLGTTNDK